MRGGRSGPTRAALALAISCCLASLSARPGQAASPDRLQAGSAPSDDAAVTFQIDAAHTGDQPSDPLTAPLVQRWAVDLGGPISYPVIAQGLVFVTVGFSGGQGARLYALDQGTGRSVWGPIDLGGGGTVSGLAYENGRVFAVNQVGTMQAFDAAGGNRLWVKTITNFQGSVQGAPVPKNGILYIGEGQWYLDAIRETDGSLLWQQSQTSGAEYSSPALTDTTVYQDYACSESEAFDRQTGTPVWHNLGTCSGAGASTPVVYQGRVYARDSEGQVPLTTGKVLDGATGATLGQFSAGPAPAFDGALGYFVVGGALHAQAIGGTVDAWHFDGDGKLNTAPIIVNGTVYVGSSSGNLYGLDASNGTQRWTANAGAPVSYHDANIGGPGAVPFAGLGAAQGVLVVPATTRMVLYSSSNAPPPASTPPVEYPVPTFPAPTPAADQVVSFQIDPQHSGRQPTDPLAPPLAQLWTRSLGGNVSYPLVVDGRVFVTVASVGSGPGPPLTRTLYAVDERTGQDLWGPLTLGSGTSSGRAHLAYDNGRLFALSDDGTLAAIDPKTGAGIWTQTFTELNGASFDAPPVAMNGNIYFSSSASCGSEYGVQESDGATIWHNRDHCTFWAMSPSLMTDGTYWTRGICTIFDLAPSNGNGIWQRWCGGDSASASPIYRDRLYVEEQNAGNRSFDRTTGQMSETGFSAETIPTFDGSTGFFLAGSTLFGEDLATNRILWTFAGDGQLATPPILVNGFLYVGSRSGNLYGVDEVSGQPVWSGRVGAPFDGPPSWFVSTAQKPVTGLAAADGLLVAPASNTLTAFAPGAFIDTPAFHSAAGFGQYHLSNSNGQTWVPLDSRNLAVTVHPTQPSTAVLGGNADLWTAQAGFNQDLGVFVSIDQGPDQLVAWKESGGYAGTFSPNAAYVHGVYSMDAGKTYRFSLGWKANKPDPGTIYAGAGPIDGRYSPTRLSVRVDSPPIPASSVVGTSQYTLKGSDGHTWQSLSPTYPGLTLSPASNGTELLQANADLWTADGGYNQDLGIFVSVDGGDERLVSWKESGGYAGTYSPNAAYVQGLLPVSAGKVYRVSLKWKANKKDPGTIYAGAGPIGNDYSPTRLSARLIGSNPTPGSEQYKLAGNNGSTWTDLGPNAPATTITPTTNGVAVLGANADLFTGTSGYNQDLGIFVSIDGGAPGLLGWKESGGFAGTMSPNAAFVEAAIQLTAGKAYTFSLKWKANRPATGATIYAGAGPIDTQYSPTSLSLELFPQ